MDIITELLHTGLDIAIGFIVSLFQAITDYIKERF